MLSTFYEEERINKIDKWITMIAILAIGIIPIVTFKYETASYSPVIMNNFYATGIKVELFNFYKFLLTLISATIIGCLLMYKVVYLNYEIKKTKLNIFVGIFTVAIVLSALFANYKDIALLGNFDRYEGSLAWLSYMVIFFALYNIEIDKKYFKYFYFAMYPFLIINAILGLLNIYRVNILANGIVQNLIGANGELGGSLWTTLYNPNFSSGICGTIFSLGFMYLLLEKDTKKRIVILIGNTLSFTIVLTSFSISGFLAIVVSLPFILLIGCKFTNKKDVVLYTGITFIINSLIFIILNKKNIRVFEESLGMFVQINNISSLIIPVCIVMLVAILFGLRYVNKKKVLNYSVIVSLILMVAAYSLYSFMLYKEEKLVEQSPKGSIVRMQDTPIFQKLEVMSSYRMTIWQETIRYTNDKVLVGQGFDTLPYTLNHNVHEGVYSNKTIDKPHNLLLTVIYGSGILGAIGFIGIMLYLIMKSLYSLIDNIENKFMYIGFIGIIAYLTQGILNDTFVGTSIIFWIIGGVCANKINNCNVKEVANT